MTLKQFLKLPGAEQTLKNFLTLPPEEQEMFKSKLCYVFNKNDNFFMYAKMIIETAEAHGFFKYVKFGSEISEAEADLIVQQNGLS